MKLRAFTLSLLFAICLQGQDLPVNPLTNFVSIRDTISLNSVSAKDFKGIIAKWRNYLGQQSNIEKIFSLKSKDETLILHFSNSFFNSSAETQKDIFTNSGSMTFSAYKRDPVFKQTSSVDATNGKVTFNFIYSIKNGLFVYEFTNFEYSGFSSGGKFEDEKPVKPFSVGLLAQNKKRWATIKTEYSERFKILSASLKSYVSDYMASMKADSEQEADKSPVNYESYKKITTGMALDDVRKMLGDEGKELSSRSNQVNNKTVLLQTIIWYNDQKTKSIMISFTDGKVSSKTQANL